MGKKYLIIAMDMANMAAGIVFKRLVNAMTDYAECEVVCPTRDNGLTTKVKTLKCPVFRRYHYRIERWALNHFGLQFSEIVWGRYAYYKISKQVQEGRYDAVLSFVYAANFAPIILGRNISCKLKLPWIVYSVDAIPKPIPWSSNTTQRSKSLIFLRKYILNADALFAANPIMLNYIIDCLNGYNGKTGVVLTPSDGINRPKTIIKAEGRELVFLYSGQMYGLRKIGPLLKGFELFLEHSANARIVFVGNNRKEEFVGFEYLLETNKIERYGFSIDIEEFYQRADVLLDINADIENDVFLSSKICNYLSYDKPIITISGEGSPVRKMMSGYNTIIHCHHNPDEICNAFLQAEKVINSDFSERADLRDRFKPEAVARGFCVGLNQIVESSNDD